MLIKENRNLNAYLIFIPFLALSLFSSILKAIFGAAGTSLNMFYPLIMGIAITWLLCHKLTKHGKFITFLLIFITVAVISSVGVIAYSGFDKNYIIINICCALTMLLGFSLAGWRSGKIFSNKRFVWMVGAWSIVSGIAVMMIYFGLLIAITKISLHNLFELFVIVPLSGIFLGLLVYLINLPYIILAIRNPFFRKRFYDCMHIKKQGTEAETQMDLSQQAEEKST